MLKAMARRAGAPGNTVVKRKRPSKPAKTSDTRNAPDPFSAVLPALAALGAISSIATINWVAEEKTPDRAKAKRKAGIAIRDLETCCLGLQEIFRRFKRHPEMFCGEGGSAASPMKFGVHGPRVSGDAARAYHQLMNDVASMLVLASQNAFDVMSAVEDGEIDAPESLFYEFGDCQDKLNRLVQDRATLGQCVDVGLAVSGTLIGLVRQLKQHRVNL